MPRRVFPRDLRFAAVGVDLAVLELQRLPDPGRGSGFDLRRGDAALADDGVGPGGEPLVQLAVGEVVGDVLASLRASDRVGPDRQVGEELAAVDAAIEDGQVPARCRGG